MASFMGRETLTPSSSKKRAKSLKSKQDRKVVKTPESDDADSESSSSEEDERPPAKKMKTPTASPNVKFASPKTSPTKAVSSPSKVLNKSLKLQNSKIKSLAIVSSSSSSSEAESSSDSSSSGDSSSSDSEDEKMEVDDGGKEVVEANVAPGSVGDWNPDDMEHLSVMVIKALPKTDNMTYTKRLERMNWEQIKFGVYSIEDCKKKWTSMYSKVRLYRTMAELAVDVKQLVTNNRASFEFLGKNGKLEHPDMPKKPQTAYFSFINDKRVDFKKKHPDVTNIQLTQKLAKKFQELSNSKKQKYTNGYHKEMEQFKIQYEKFKVNHPELFTTKSKKNDFQRPPYAHSIYINKRIEENLAHNPKASRKELTVLYKEKWDDLKQSKKDFYIKKAIEKKISLEHDVEEYCKTHPDFDPTAVKKMCQSRTKPEQEVMDKALGKPTKPLKNGYQYFIAATMPTLHDVAYKTKMTIINSSWKQMSVDDKAVYMKIAEEKQNAYKREYDVWKAGLSPEAMQKLESAGKVDSPMKTLTKMPIPSSQPIPSSPSTQTTITQTLQQKPISAMFLYIEENKVRYKQKHHKASDADVTKALTKKYQGLSEEKKQKYKAIEMEKKKKQLMVTKENGIPSSPANKTSVPSSPAVKTKAAKVKPFPGEPKKPPTSGYLLFTTEMLNGELQDVPNKQRMLLVGQKWKELSDAEKKEFNEKKDKRMKKYAKEIEKFKKTLSPEDLAKFDEIRNAKKTRSKKKEVPKPVIKKEEQPDPSSSSSVSSSSESSSSSSSSGSDSESDDASEETPAVKSPPTKHASPSKLVSPKARKSPKIVQKKKAESSDDSSSESDSGKPHQTLAADKSPPTKHASPSKLVSPKARKTPKIVQKKKAESSDDSSSESDSGKPHQTLAAVHQKLSSSGSDSSSESD